MTACDHSSCAHGHWSTHRHCQVDGCDFVEPRGASFGNFVQGHFVCPAHWARSVALAARPNGRAGYVTLAQLAGERIAP